MPIRRSAQPSTPPNKPVENKPSVQPVQSAASRPVNLSPKATPPPSEKYSPTPESVRREENLKLISKNIRELVNDSRMLQAAMRFSRDENEAKTLVGSQCESAVAYITNPRNKDRWLISQANPGEVCDAVLKLANMGLIADGVGGDGYIRPYLNKKTGRVTVTALPGIRGMEKTIMRSGLAESIKSESVRRQDRFEVTQGTEGEKVVFSRNVVPDLAKQNDVVGGYSLIKFKDSRTWTSVKRCMDPEVAKQLLAQRNELGQLQDLAIGNLETEGYVLLKKHGEESLMDLDTQAKYSAQRDVMRQVIRTALQKTSVNEIANEMLRMESAYQNHVANDIRDRAEAVRRGQSAGMDGVEIVSMGAQPEQAPERNPLDEALSTRLQLEDENEDGVKI